jgi:hypothetical protein
LVDADAKATPTSALWGAGDARGERGESVGETGEQKGRRRQKKNGQHIHSIEGIKSELLAFLVHNVQQETRIKEEESAKSIQTHLVPPLDVFNPADNDRPSWISRSHHD